MENTLDPSAAENKAMFIVEPWNVVLLNDAWHTFDEVIIQLVRATRYAIEKAEKIAWEAHSHGEAICYTGTKKRCRHVASVLEEIKIGVRLERMF
jgi:ATP-dependent Clp protease adaptor protein ClpS